MIGDVYDRLTACKGFEWDEGIRSKSADRHAVAAGEAEQPFFRQPFLVTHDVAHSPTEERLFALGQSGLWARAVPGFHASGRQGASHFGPRYEPSRARGL
jgi:uncharacterized DUF497 family protein